MNSGSVFNSREPRREYMRERLAEAFGGSNRVPARGCCSYYAGDRGKHGEVVRGYVACDLTDRTPKQAEQLYRKHSAIETSYRVFRQARAITTIQGPYNVQS